MTTTTPGSIDAPALAQLLTLSTPTAFAALGSAVVGGVLYAFSAFVMRGLDGLQPTQSVAAMQQINLAAPRAGLMVPLMGTLLLSLGLLVAGLVAVRRDHGAGWWLVAGAVLYLAAFAVTAAYHVPHNDALAQVDAAGPGAAAAWHDYAAAWTRLNHVRAAAALAASVSYVVALLRLH